MSKRQKPTGSGSGLALVLAFSFIAAACAPDAPVAPAVDLSFAKGSNPAGGTGITPIKLGDPKALGCSSAEAKAVNSASSTVVGGHCVRSQPTPFLWTAGIATLPVAESGMINFVSGSGTAYGHRNSVPFLKAPSSPAVYLPMPAGMSAGDIRASTDDDDLLFGDLWWQDGANTYGKSAVWARTGSGWTISDFPGIPEDVTPNGAMVVGRSSGRAAFWTNVAGTWTPQPLPDNGATSSQAYGVNESGSVIVGVRYLQLTSDPSQSYDEHVAWVANGTGGWNLEILGGLNIGEGTAADVSDQLDGSTVAVGRSWDDTSGPGGQLWAVAWRKPAGSSHFAAPVRLAPLSKGSTAFANAVNSKGEVVGKAFTRSGGAAVMWKLP